jgi:hypothetical protein
MMLTTKFSRRILAGAAVLILAAGAAWADGYSSHRWNEPSSFQRFSLSLDGGFGLAGGHRGTLDAKTEFQFGLSRRIRIGLGVGYAGGGNGWGRDGGYGLRTTEQAALDAAAQGEGIREMGPRQSYRIVPVTLNVYYFLPLGRRWNLFAGGGGSVSFGSFHGLDVREHRTAWGGQAGLGAEYRLSRRLTLIAQGEYRLAEFGRLAKLSPATDAADSKESGRALQPFSRFALNGAVFHLGAKFGF